MHPQTANALSASSRLSQFVLTVDDLDITKPARAFRFVGVTRRTAVTLAADRLREVAASDGVSYLALSYTMKEVAQ
jgi:hypothetical protein